MRDSIGLPILTLTVTLLGVGGLARDIGYPIGAAMLSTVLIWAAPGQLLMFGAIASGAALPTVAVAVSLSSIRFLPMTMALMPLLRHPGMGVSKQLFLAHFMSITPWLHGMRVLPDMPQAERVPYYMGFAITVFTAAVLATGIGHVLMSSLPAPLAAALLFTSPLFFLLSMMALAKAPMDWLALAFGLGLTPIALALVPGGFDLLAVGLSGGTAAYLIGPMIQARKRPR